MEKGTPGRSRVIVVLKPGSDASDEIKKRTETFPWAVEKRDGKVVFVATLKDGKSQMTYRREEPTPAK